MVAISERFDEGVEVCLSEADIDEGLLPDAMDGISEVIFDLQRTTFSLH